MEDSKRRWCFAAAYHSRLLQLRTLRSMQTAVRMERKKRRRRALAANLYRYSLGLKILKGWRAQTLRLRARRQVLATASRIGGRFRMRLTFQRWRLYADKCHRTPQCHSSHKIHALSDFSEPVLMPTIPEGQLIQPKMKLVLTAISRYHLRKGFSKWKYLVDSLRTALSPSKPYLCRQLARFQCRQALYRWHRSLTRSKERSVLRLRAYFFLYYHLMKTSLQRLRAYARKRKQYEAVRRNVKHRLERKLLWEAMYKWSGQRSTRRALMGWHDVAAARRQQRFLLQSKANALAQRYEGRLQRQVFQLWRSLFEERGKGRTLRQALEKHFVLKMLQLGWRQWLILVSKMKHLEEFQTKRRAKVMQQIWDVWKARTKEKTLKELNRRRAVRHRYLGLLRAGFEKLRARLERRQTLSQKVVELEQKTARKQKAESFRAMVMYVNRKREIKVHVALADHHYRINVLRRTFVHKLQTYTHNRFRRREKMQQAIEHCHQKKISTTFSHWKTFLYGEQLRSSHLKSLYLSMKAEKDRAMCQRVWNNWMEYDQTKRVNRIVNAEMRGRWQRLVLKRTWGQWQSGISAIRCEYAASERAKRHAALILKKRMLQWWHERIVDRKTYREQNRRALVQWKVAKQRPCFEVLRKYVDKKKMDRDRLHEALEMRHEWLVRNGLRHWMTGALHVRFERDKKISEGQAVRTAQVWRRVAKVARHWRALTLRRMQSTRNNRAYAPQGTHGIYTRQRGLDSLTSLQETLFDPTSVTRTLGSRRTAMPRTYANDHGDGNGLSYTIHEKEASMYSDYKSPSGLSAFVMLPRTRPQPRKPVELLVNNWNGNDEAATCRQNASYEKQEQENVGVNRRMKELNDKYGFRFQPTTTATCPIATSASPRDLNNENDDQSTRKTQPYHLSTVTRTASSDPMSLQLEKLEDELSYWRSRKLERKELASSISDLRQRVQTPSHELLDHSEQHEGYKELHRMEQRFRQLDTEWTESIDHIQELVHEVHKLRQSVGIES